LIDGMKNKRSKSERIELSAHIVADPEICHGKPTFKGTRIMVWQVLDALARGESSDEIVAARGGRVSRAAIADTVRLARRTFLDRQGRLTPAAKLRRAA
jgi:uncharacterized protein (DUF433 family)